MYYCSVSVLYLVALAWTADCCETVIVLVLSSHKLVSTKKSENNSRRLGTLGELVGECPVCGEEQEDTMPSGQAQRIERIAGQASNSSHPHVLLVTPFI